MLPPWSHALSPIPHPLLANPYSARHTYNLSGNMSLLAVSLKNLKSRRHSDYISGNELQPSTPCESMDQSFDEIFTDTLKERGGPLAFVAARTALASQQKQLNSLSDIQKQLNAAESRVQKEAQIKRLLVKYDEIFDGFSENSVTMLSAAIAQDFYATLFDDTKGEMTQLADIQYEQKILKKAEKIDKELEPYRVLAKQFSLQLINWSVVYERATIIDAGYSDVIDFLIRCPEGDLAKAPAILITLDQVAGQRWLDKHAAHLILKPDLGELIGLVLESEKFKYRLPITRNRVTGNWELSSIILDIISTFRNNGFDKFIKMTPHVGRQRGGRSNDNIVSYSLSLNTEHIKIIKECPLFHYNKFQEEFLNLQRDCYPIDAFIYKAERSKYFFRGADLKKSKEKFNSEERIEIKKRKGSLPFLLIMLAIAIILIIFTYL